MDGVVSIKIEKSWRNNIKMNLSQIFAIEITVTELNAWETY